MAESNKDESSAVKRILGKSLSRKEFLVLAGAATGAGLAKLKLKSLDAQFAAAVARAAAKQKQETEDPKNMQKKETPDFEVKVFHNLSNEEQRSVDEKIERMKSNFDDHEGRCKRISQYEDLITTVTEKYGIPKELLIGLIFAESGGDRMAVSDDAGAKGITQVIDFIAEAWSKDGDFKFTNDENDDRFNVPKVLDYSCRELASYYKKFEDWGLAFWAWHAGEPRVYKAVRTYFQVKEKIDLGDILSEPDETKAEQMQEEYRQKIKTICVDSLLQTPQVKELFQGDEWNKTDEYCYRIVAGAEIYYSKR